MEVLYPQKPLSPRQNWMDGLFPKMVGTSVVTKTSNWMGQQKIVEAMATKREKVEIAIVTVMGSTRRDARIQ